jgi:hypothetical protein
MRCPREGWTHHCPPNSRRVPRIMRPDLVRGCASQHSRFMRAKAISTSRHPFADRGRARNVSFRRHNNNVALALQPRLSFYPLAKFAHAPQIKRAGLPLIAQIRTVAQANAAVAEGACRCRRVAVAWQISSSKQPHSTHPPTSDQIDHR